MKENIEFIRYCHKAYKSREKWIDMIKKSKNINWVNTKSGSKKFWAINYETVYNPTYNRASLKLPESYVNDQGEVMGKSGHSPKYEQNDLSKGRERTGAIPGSI